jgi:hypothetical protein
MPPQAQRKGDFMLRSASCCAAFLIATIAVAHPGLAQSWLDQGKKLLDSTTKSAPSGSSGAMGLSSADIAAGLRDALKVGTERVVNTLGKADGFNSNPEIHIPLPDSLKKVQSALKTVGMSQMADDLELRLNRAAEAAAPKAKAVFWDAIADMSMDDVKRIYDGPKDAATQYFKGKMSGPLAESMKPVVDSSLADVGAIKAYDSMMGQYKTMPFVPDVKANLTSHVLDKALGALFLYLGREEAAIRENPAKRTTELLQKVFGAS